VIAIAAASDVSDAGATLALVGVGGFFVWVGRRIPGRLPAAASPATIALGAMIIWASAPDTESALVLGAAMVGPLVADGALPRERCADTRPGAWVVPALALVWSAGIGFAGRPDGLAVLLVAAGAVGGWGLVDRRGRRRAHPVGLAPTAAALLGTSVVGVVAARTIGLRSDLDAGAAALTAALTAASLIPWWFLAHSTRRPRRGRTHDLGSPVEP
jgi:hypothetical protein